MMPGSCQASPASPGCSQLISKPQLLLACMHAGNSAQAWVRSQAHLLLLDALQLIHVPLLLIELLSRLSNRCFHIHNALHLQGRRGSGTVTSRLRELPMHSWTIRPVSRVVQKPCHCNRCALIMCTARHCLAW